MLNKLIKILLIILFIILPLINSHLLDFFGLTEIWQNFYVNWNYEFSKVIYFNIFSSIILFLFFIKTITPQFPLSGDKKSLFPLKRGLGGSSPKKRVRRFPKIIFPIIFILIVSTIFSIFPEVSLFWNSDKAHSFVMFMNLIWIYILLINLDYSLKRSLLFWTVLWLFPVIYFAWWEFFYPHYDYWDLSNRAFWTFGHPNYLALYLLLFLPIVTTNEIKLNKNINYFLIIWLVSVIILTKSALAIFLCFSYLIFYFTKKDIYKKYFIIWIIFLWIVSLIIILQNFWYSKLHSFISRFYIWETTWNIILSNIKTFLIWNWTETLSYIFDNFKSPYLYIFENFWFTADRPHNIFLNIFYHFWIFGLVIFLYLVWILIFKKYWVYKQALVLALIFLCFNYASIASYLVIVLFISFLIPPFKGGLGGALNFIVIFFITSFSIVWAYFSYELYKSEIMIYKWNYINWQRNYIFWEKIYKIKTCEEELESWNKSAEVYFYCWDIKYNKDNPEAWIKYYKLWLKKLPDLWNKNSKYYDNILIKNNPDILHRFYAKKYSDLEEILKIVWIKKD